MQKRKRLSGHNTSGTLVVTILYALASLHMFKVFTFKRRLLQGPLILMMPISGLHIALDPLEDEAIPQFMPLAT